MGRRAFLTVRKRWKKEWQSEALKKQKCEVTGDDLYTDQSNNNHEEQLTKHAPTQQEASSDVSKFSDMSNIQQVQPRTQVMPNSQHVSFQNPGVSSASESEQLDYNASESVQLDYNAGESEQLDYNADESEQLDYNASESEQLDYNAGESVQLDYDADESEQLDYNDDESEQLDYDADESEQLDYNDDESEQLDYNDDESEQLDYDAGKSEQLDYNTSESEYDSTDQNEQSITLHVSQGHSLYDLEPTNWNFTSNVLEFPPINSIGMDTNLMTINQTNDPFHYMSAPVLSAFRLVFKNTLQELKYSYLNLIQILNTSGRWFVLPSDDDSELRLCTFSVNNYSSPIITFTIEIHHSHRWFLHHSYGFILKHRHPILQSLPTYLYSGSEI